MYRCFSSNLYSITKRKKFFVPFYRNQLNPGMLFKIPLKKTYSYKEPWKSCLHIINRIKKHLTSINTWFLLKEELKNKNERIISKIQCIKAVQVAVYFLSGQYHLLTFLTMEIIKERKIKWEVLTHPYFSTSLNLRAMYFSLWL